MHFQTSGHGPAEAERFVLLVRRLEAFLRRTGFDHALMPNHFHLLRHVPETKALSELELLERIEAGDMRTAQLSERNGELSLPECSRYLIRYFTYGVDPGGTYASTPAKEFCPAPDINFSGRSEM